MLAAACRRRSALDRAETATRCGSNVPVGTSLRLISTAEAAQWLKVVPRTIRRWLASGRLTGQRIGGVLVADEAAVAELELARRDGGH